MFEVSDDIFIPFVYRPIEAKFSEVFLDFFKMAERIYTKFCMQIQNAKTKYGAKYQNFLMLFKKVLFFDSYNLSAVQATKFHGVIFSNATAIRPCLWSLFKPKPQVAVVCTVYLYYLYIDG